MRSKTIKRSLRIMICVLVITALIAFSEEISARQEEDIVELSSNELLLVLDMELPTFVGKKFTVIFTAVTKAPTVTVTMYFDGFVSQPVWQATSDFFINQEATIDCVAAEILVGVAHQFYILAEDSEGQSKTIVETMTVDVDDPIFTFLSLEHIDVNKQVTKIEDIEPVAMKEDESLRLNWTVQDENFLRLIYFIDGDTDGVNYGASASLNIDWKNFQITTEGVTEQTYSLKIIASDKAKNTVKHSWLIKYSQPLDPVIDEDKYKQDLAEKEKQTQAAKNGAIWGSTLFGLVGAIGAVFSAKFSRDNLKGYAGIRDRDGLVDIEDKTKHFHYKKPRHRFTRSRFGLIVSISSSIIGLLLIIAFCLALFLQPSAETYFATYFFKTSLASLLLFFIIIFATSFQLIKGDFDDIFSNKTDEPKNQAAGWLISFFSESDKKHLITDSFIDSCNGDYFDITFTDRDRMNYDLNISGDTLRTMYIPAKDIKITKDGLEIVQFEMKGQKHIQEILDGKNPEERKRAQMLSEINETIAIELKDTKDNLDKTQQNIRTLARREADDLLIGHELTAAALNKQIVSKDVKKPQGEQKKDDQGKNVSNTE
ncbi:MAG: hypothetical protein E3J70_01625 [Candidatus Heimdallarchaeota archaeon]|nr:MAG: hypothetical protein E3J70_01625 [Candidatus Heimdallarchaeota archaeon]